MRMIPRKEKDGIHIGPSCTSFGREVVIVNPGEGKGYHRHSYVITLGAYGWTRLLVHAGSLNDALEACAEWCGDHAPGLLANEQVAEVYVEAKAEGLSDEEAYERATEDVMSFDCGRYMSSYEANIDLEDPTRFQLIEYCFPSNVKWTEQEGLAP